MLFSLIDCCWSELSDKDAVLRSEREGELYIALYGRQKEVVDRIIHRLHESWREVGETGMELDVLHLPRENPENEDSIIPSVALEPIS